MAGRITSVDGVSFSSLDDALFDDAGATKRDLVAYLEAAAPALLEQLRDRPLTVVRARPGQTPFMQKNLPKYAPEWIQSVAIWSNASHREVRYPLGNDRRTLMWLANQRCVEFHPTLSRGPDGEQTHLVVDLDPPDTAGPADAFRRAVAVAHHAHGVVQETRLAAAVKTSGAKGLHVVVPLLPGQAPDDVAAACRALGTRVAAATPELATVEFAREQRGGKVFVDCTRTHGATLICAYSPRARAGVPVSFPVAWESLNEVMPADFTILTVPPLLDGGDPWADLLPEPQRLPESLVAEGQEIPVARVQAMHEGKRRARGAAPDRS